MSDSRPFFSICIPQYSRIPFVIECIRSIIDQTFKNVEVCISDDSNIENLENDLTRFLKTSGLNYKYRAQKNNRRYDGNLRTSLLMASGQYCFLMGNDDALHSPNTLQDLHDFIAQHPKTEVLISNYIKSKTNTFVNRIRPTGYLGNGQDVAISHFRNFSFVSGILLKNSAARSEKTRSWDGSEMYQMFLGCRIIAKGGMLSAYEKPVILEGIQIPEHDVDSIHQKVAKETLEKKRFKIRFLPLIQLPALVCDAIMANENFGKISKVYFQYYFMPCLYWLFEYKRTGGYKYYLETILGLHPRYTMQRCPAKHLTRCAIYLYYSCLFLITAICPYRIFFKVEPSLHKIAKK